MKRDMLKEHLAQVERHIAESRRRIERQRQRIEELVRRGGDASRSKALLELFEETLARHYKDRDRLRSKLPKANNRRR
jgi:predicted  nucleic acid-binding Zn-ribbon protein